MAMLLEGIERTLVSEETVLCSAADKDYLCGLVNLSLEDPKLDVSVIPELRRLELIAEETGRSVDLLRLCNQSRHAVLGAIGTFPAEWDLIMADSIVAGKEASSVRAFFPGVSVYAEDIRSPFNLGSIFRTSEAFGAEKVLLSPLCVPPSHPRAQRSAMGCIDYIPWEQISLDDLPDDIPVFALETGGTMIEDFEFPNKGIVIIGSEELGISPEGLARATYGRVSIPMKGIKASINVGVAFGILMQAWTSYLSCSESNPA